MKKQQILLTIGACALISVSFAVLFAYLIPSSKSVPPFQFLSSSSTSTASRSNSRVEYKDFNFYLDGKQLISKGNDNFYLQLASFRVTHERIVGGAIENSDKTILCFGVSYKDSVIYDTYCVNSRTYEMLWGVYDQFTEATGTPNANPQQFLDNEKYTYQYFHEGTDSLVKTEYLFRASDAAFAGPEYRNNFAAAFVEVANQFSDYDFFDRYDYVNKLNTDILNSKDSKKLNQHYFVEFLNDTDAKIRIKYNCPGDCDDTTEGVGAEFNLEFRNGEWEILSDPEIGLICLRGGSFGESCV
ncbi:MAG: hypothetical protein JNK26_02565 [Candidatus Doudnabacteria bacterium]|nr:hypothetical protein [Candidatus Doudnabacteria bacterium]